MSQRQKTTTIESDDLNSDLNSDFISDFKPDFDTWIVSDLTSKMLIQKKLLKKKAILSLQDEKNISIVLEENTVLRANELWHKLIMQSHVDYKEVSLDFILVYASQWLSSQKTNWAQSSDASKLLIQFMTQLMPFFIQPDGVSILKSWVSEHHEKYIQWAHWAKLSEQFWFHLKEKKIFCSHWAPSLLLEKSDFSFQWERPLFFDLGSQLTLIEVELLLKLSSIFSISVIVPNNFEKYKDVWPYKFLLEQNKNKQVQIIFEKSTKKTEDFEKENDEKNSSSLKYLRQASMLGEVKSVVSQIRIWLDEGVKMNQIAILAPNIENYWPVLNKYLAKEGVFYQKKYLLKYIHLPMIQKWFSTIHLFSEVFKFEDLENYFFSNSNEEKKIKYDFFNFKRKFINTIDENLLNNDIHLKKHISKFQKRSKELIKDTEKANQDEFVNWLIMVTQDLGSLSRQNESIVLELLRAVLETGFKKVQMSLNNWIYFLEKIASKTEWEPQLMKSESFDQSYFSEAGVLCENIESYKWMEVTHIFLLGLSDEQLSSKSVLALSDADIQSIFQETGYYLQNFQDKNKEFELRSILDNSFYEKIIFSYPETDFQSKVQSASKFWIKGAFQSNTQEITKIQPQQLTLWDELQLDKNLISPNNILENSICVEQNIMPFSDFGQNISKSLSVSQLESYETCPFKFAAKKLFHLYDLPELDLDLDHLTKGQVMHGLFEALTQSPMKYKYSEKEMSQVVDSVFSQLEYVFQDQVLKKQLMSYYIQLGFSFLSFEKKWREQFPETQTIGREVPLKGYWHQEKGELLSEESEILFKGYIDRIDKDEQGNYVIIDYKSSDSQAKNYKTWLNNNQLQLSVYAEAIENGCTELKPNNVQGAFYYVSKKLDRTKGFRVKDVDQGLFDENENKSSQLSLEEKKQLFKGINEKVKDRVDHILKGQFEPRPQKIENCETCYWRNLCRAPHLI